MLIPVRIRLVFSCIALIIFCACRQKPASRQKQTNNNQPKKHWAKINEVSAAGFDEFFKLFETDSVMQVAHVQFPLKVIYKEEEGDSIKIMQKSDWHFSGGRFIKGLIVSKININPNEMHVLYQIEDTGVNTIYLFKRKAQTWQLQQIEDSSD